MRKNVVIIGNGVAGITCARHIRKQSNFDITVISSESKYFYSRTALMYIFMGHMKYEHTKPYEDWFWDKNRIKLVKDHVTLIDIKDKIHFDKQHIEAKGRLVVVDFTATWCGVTIMSMTTRYKKKKTLLNYFLFPLFFSLSLFLIAL